MKYLQHAVMALVLQAMIGLAFGNWWAGAAVASAYFLGREAAQAEYRWIERFGEGRRANLPWWGVFDLRVWPKPDQWIDWLGPVLATVALAWAMHRG